MNEKIGLGIITCQPRKSFDKCFDFWHHMVDYVVVVNDGKDFDYNWNSNFRSLYISKIPETTLIYHHNNKNLGVGKSKNIAIKQLLNQGCDHIFLMEDDIYIKDNSVFRKYIEASKATGIQHFNFSQHGIMNKTFDGLSNPNPRMIVKYGDIQVPLYPHCVGAFSYFSRKCLETVGLMDEEYYNACEHMDQTLEIIKAGMHPPFWFFADIENSWKYLGDEPWSLQQSTISSKSDHTEVMRAADAVFFKKHGHYPLQTPLTSEEGVVKSLKEIKKNYANL
jgi:GT2 family glycosyltransferase